MTSGSDLPEYLSSLNPEQLQAVLHKNGPLLILAGAGTGKTRVITTKIAYLVRECGIFPDSVLAVTFTNKAAREMRERAAAIEPACSRAVIRTFHSFGAWFLRRNAAAAGIDPNFVIYDDGDSAELLHAAIPQFSRQECSRYAGMIARAKDYGLEPDSPDLDYHFRDDEFRRIYAVYQERLGKTGNVDFGDLIRLPSALLAEDETIARRTRQRFRVIMVDEYQDSNVAQFQLLQRLAGPETYLCVVGDDDQSIYRFRGAEVKNILSFPKAFPGATTIRLERNYRSYQSILDIAGDVVSRNSGRLGKTLRATRPGGRKPQLALLDDQDQEIDFCASIAKAHLRNGGKLSDIAILYRTNAQSLGFEKEFPHRGIPYRIVGALRFYEREEVKDLLAYLSLVMNPRDEIAFRRVVNKPARGIGASSEEIILGYATRRGCALPDACRACLEDMRGKGKTGLQEFLGILDWAESVLDARENGLTTGGTDAGEKGPYSLSDGGAVSPGSGNASLAVLLEGIIRKSGLAGYHKSQDEISGTQKLANMDELANAASMYPLVREGLAEFLETVELDRSFQSKDEGAQAEALTLITMHNTKGLEFPVVIVTGLEQGLFPRDDEEGEDLEEQRRLFYVALTRAKDSLYMTGCRWRRMRGRLFETTPSRFLLELKPELYELWGVRKAHPLLGRRPDGYPGRQRAECPPQAPAGTDWKRGQAVYHDEYGNGVIVKVSPTESSGPLVIVQFESGKQAQFFPKYTKKLERLKE